MEERIETPAVKRILMKAPAQSLELLTVPVERPNGSPPLLMLPGAFHGASAFAEHWMPHLAARGYLTYALSYRGHGGSGGSYAGASLQDYLVDVERAMTSFETRPILVGHSLGGYLAQHLVAKADYPGAVLVAPVPHRGMPFSLLAANALRHPLRLLRALVSGDMRPFAEGASMVRRNFFSSALSESDLLHYSGLLGGESLRAYSQLGPFGPFPDVTRCRTPMLVLAGAEDWAFTPRRLRRTAAVYGADFVEVEGSGHDIMLDVAWRAAADAVDRWVAQWATHPLRMAPQAADISRVFSLPRGPSSC